MQSREIRKFDMLRRVQQFLDANAAQLGQVNAMAGRKELDQIVQEMGANEAGQATSAQTVKGHTAKLAVLRKDLWMHHMAPLAAIAAANLRQVPEFSALRLPSERVKAAVLVQHAIAMADAARAHQAVFVENGCASNFADELVAAASALRAVIDTRAQSIGARASARKGIKTASSRADRVLKVLDRKVKSVLEDDPKTLAGWSSAKRMGKGRVLTLVAPSEGGQVQPQEVKAA